MLILGIGKAHTRNRVHQNQFEIPSYMYKNEKIQNSLGVNIQKRYKRAKTVREAPSRVQLITVSFRHPVNQNEKHAHRRN